MLRESLEMSRRELGPEHPDVAGGATNLAYWLTVGGRVRRGGATDRREPRDPPQGPRQRPSAGREHADRAGQPARGARSSYAEALAGAIEALRILEASLPDDHWQIAMAKNVQGAALAGPRPIPGSREAPAREPAGARGLADCGPAPARPRAAGGPLYGLGQTGRSRKVRPLGSGIVHITPRSARPAPHGQVMHAPN